MATYRYFRIEFWQDDFIAELTPEEKYFYAYLMTNPKTTQCGIFKLVKKFVEAETGYNRETIDKLIKRFIDYGKILYCEETKELMLLNWPKYNFTDSKNTILCINKELKEVKNKEFINVMYKLCLEQKLDKKIDVKSIFKDIEIEMNSEENEEKEGFSECHKGSSESFEGAYKPLGEKEIEKYEEKSSSNKQKVTNENKSISKVLLEFNKNICKPTKGDIEKMQSWIRGFEEEVIIAAIGEAVKYKAKHIGYIETVINNWRELGITTMEKLKQHKKPGSKDNNMCNAAAYKYVD